MLRFLPPPARGALALTLILLNTIFWCVPLYAITLARLLIPNAGWRRACARASVWIGETWIAGNNLIFRLTQKTRWEFTGIDDLRRDDWYFITANHQSWVDIFVLQRALNRRTPFLRFFIKQELIWFPLMGAAWWALDFPFMKRYSRAYLEKHPEKRGEDLATTRRKCAKFQHDPVAIINFLEGDALHARQARPAGVALHPPAAPQGRGNCLCAGGDERPYPHPPRRRHRLPGRPAAQLLGIPLRRGPAHRAARGGHTAARPHRGRRLHERSGLPRGVPKLGQRPLGRQRRAAGKIGAQSGEEHKVTQRRRCGTRRRELIVE
jgi:hypothetical protein